MFSSNSMQMNIHIAEIAAITELKSFPKYAWSPNMAKLVKTINDRVCLPTVVTSPYV